jgi:SAM-dependent methyltransferase
MPASADATPAPGHPFRFSTLAHAGLDILGPMVPEELDAIVDDALGALGALDLPSGSPTLTALDIGCGKGDVLVRLARRGVRGTGLDRNRWFIADAAALVARAGVSALVELRVADAMAEPLPRGFDFVACIGATGALGGPVRAPQAIAELLPPGGIAIIGEVFWQTPPPTDAAAAFGIEPGEMVGLDETVARVTAGGLEPLAVRVAGQSGWDAYEDAYAGAIERWAAANDADPDRAVFLERVSMMRATWAAWRRDSMGFAVVVATRPGR